LNNGVLHVRETQVPPQNYSLVRTHCVPIRPFPTAGSLSCTETVLIVIIRPYINQDSPSCHRSSRHYWMARWAWTFCAVLLQFYLVQRIQLSASTIVPNICRYYDDIHFSICILKLQGFSVSASPRIRVY